MIGLEIMEELNNFDWESKEKEVSSIDQPLS
jgi:hypothetical protein